MKKCSNCFQDKDYSEFSTSNKKYGDGFHAYCKPCQSAYYKAYNEARKAAQATVVVSSKVCRDCGLEKPISQFGKRSISADKHNIYCKPCWRQICYKSQREYVKRHG